MKPFLFFFCFPFFCLLRKKTGRGACPLVHPGGAVHQESMLSLLFFFIVRRTSPESFRSCCLCLILYTFNLLISAKFIKEPEKKSILSRKPDMIEKSCDCMDTVYVRVRSAWRKFHKLQLVFRGTYILVTPSCVPECFMLVRHDPHQQKCRANCNKTTMPW